MIIFIHDLFSKPLKLVVIYKRMQFFKRNTTLAMKYKNYFVSPKNYAKLALFTLPNWTISISILFVAI